MRLGLSSEVRIYNPQEKKLDPRTISGHFVGYAEKSKGYKFYCPYHITRIVELRNAKFLENDLISGSDQLRDFGSEINYIESQPSTLSQPTSRRDDEGKIDKPKRSSPREKTNGVTNRGCTRIK